MHRPGSRDSIDPYMYLIYSWNGLDNSFQQKLVVQSIVVVLYRIKSNKTQYLFL